MQYDFSERVAMVTGGASGMGLAAVEAFANAGAAVAIVDVNEIDAQKVADDLSTKGCKAIAIACDVANESQVKAMVDNVVETFGRLDFAFNNAGVQSPAIDTADASGEEYDRVQGINMRGVWNCMKYELIQMRKQGEGSIVNNSSMGGIIGLPGRAIYHATKHGVLGMTKSAALEVAAKGIRINAICPGIIETPMVMDMLDKEPELMDELIKQQPIKRLGKAEEVAQAVLWLCSSASSFVIGHALVVDGGYTVP